MRCEYFEELITEYLDGELPLHLKEEFEKHLFECENCRDLFEQIKENMELLREFKEEVEFDFQPENNIFITRRHEKREFIKRFLATAAIFIMGIFMLRGVVAFRNVSLNSLLIDTAQSFMSVAVNSQKLIFDAKNFGERALSKFDGVKNDFSRHYREFEKEFSMNKNPNYREKNFKIGR